MKTIIDHQEKSKKLEIENARLHQDIQKYRIALNRIASPGTWGIYSGHHVEIARRALIIGVEVDPLPEEAKLRPHGPNCKCPPLSTRRMKE